MNWRQAAVDFLFPPKCPFCRRVTEGARVCPQCGKDLPWTEGKDREQTLAGGLRCASPLWYEDLARDGILRFKFHGGAGAETLGSLLADCAGELLAESACRRWDTEPVPLLRKITDNPAQSSLSGAAARRANVLGVYDSAGDCRGKRVLLIDDIVTTGETLKECARVLKGAGAADVLALTLARTREQDEPSPSGG